MLNIFDLLPSIMQRESSVYFCPPIDIYTVFPYEYNKQYQR